MAANDPRKFTIKPCNSRVAVQADRQKTTFDALKNITRLDIQSRIIDGLKTLIRTHSILDGKGRPFIGDAFNQIFAATGVTNPRAINLINKIEVDQLNIMVDRIQGFADRLTTGDVTFSDIPGIVSDLLAIEEASKKILPEPPPAICKSPWYAEDLLRYGMKFRSFFMVNFVFYPQYSLLMRNQIHSFLIKRMERPTFVVDHEEVNFYNYRVRVPKKTFFNPINIEFYDDDKNHTMEFYHNLLEIMRPMSNISPNTPFNLEKKGGDYSRKDFRGIDGKRNPNGIKVNQYVGTVGPYAEDTNYLLKEIIIVHIYDNATKFNEFHLYRPLIEQMTPDELSVEDTSPPSIQMQVGFSNLFLRTAVPINKLDSVIDQPMPTKFESFATLEQAIENANPPSESEQETVDPIKSKIEQQVEEETTDVVRPFNPLKDLAKLDIFKSLL